MTTLQTTSPSEEPETARISRGDLAFICARNQHEAHNLLLRSLKQSGMSQKELAIRTGIDQAVISRLLRRPRNMELNTFSKLLYGACGAALVFLPAYSQTQNTTASEIAGETISLGLRLSWIYVDTLEPGIAGTTALAIGDTYVSPAGIEKLFEVPAEEASSMDEQWITGSRIAQRFGEEHVDA